MQNPSCPLKYSCMVGSGDAPGCRVARCAPAANQLLLVLELLAATKYAAAEADPSLAASPLIMPACAAAPLLPRWQSRRV